MLLGITFGGSQQGFVNNMFTTPLLLVLLHPVRGKKLSFVAFLFNRPKHTANQEMGKKLSVTASGSLSN